MREDVCRKNKHGYCMYGDTCHFRHIDEVCSDKICNVFNCEKRHPKLCKFFREYHRCKFTTFCRYSHTVTDNDEQIKEIEIKMWDKNWSN